MNSEDKKWLLEEFPKYKGRTMMKETVTAYLKAEMLLNGWEKVKQRTCSCHLRGLADGVNAAYNTFIKSNG
jgi:hypothetical protein